MSRAPHLDTAPVIDPASSSTFRCPHCHELFNVQRVVAGGGWAADAAPHPRRTVTSGTRRPEPQPGETVRNHQAQPARQELRKKAAQAAQQAHQRATARRVAKKCPDHGRAVPSRFGGLYCTAPDPTSPTGWCRWTSAKSRGAA